MSSVFSRIRSGASKAAFEADKLRRIASVQSVIKSLKEEITQAFSRAGYVASDLHRTGRITQPELREACERIASLQAQIAAREREIETIRSQAYVEPTRGPQYGHLCPNGHGVLPPGPQVPFARLAVLLRFPELASVRSVVRQFQSLSLRPELNNFPIFLRKVPLHYHCRPWVPLARSVAQLWPQKLVSAQSAARPFQSHLPHPQLHHSP